MTDVGLPCCLLGLGLADLLITQMWFKEDMIAELTEPISRLKEYCWELRECLEVELELGTGTELELERNWNWNLGLDAH